jgi:PAP2 superfamily C-terminal
MKWPSFFNNKYFRNEFIISLVILVVTLICFSKFLNFNESRNGISLEDPLLHFFSAVNLTWFTFILIYLSIVAILISIISNPNKLVFAIQCYSLMILIRMFMMFLMPLNPPEGMIPLNDPFVQFFGTGKILTKDLFFSGHTATIFLFYLLSEKKILKLFFLSATIFVGASVLLQHVHYAVDVVSAPFFSYLSYRMIYLLQTKKLKLSIIQVL